MQSILRGNNPVKGFLALLSFLTIIPTGVHDIYLAARSFYTVPLIGFIEGLIVVLPFYTSLPVGVKAVIALLLSYIITGLNHVDGFADFVDAIASRKRGGEALKVIKEPWKGPMAIASTILLVLVTYTCLQHLYKYTDIIVVAHILAAESMYLLAVFSNKPDYRGLGTLFIEESKKPPRVIANIAVFLALLIVLVLVYASEPITTITFMAMSLGMMASVFYTYVKSHSILGYSNGDVLGFCYELTRTLVLLLAVIPLTIA